jgi:hypothetical protein
MPVTPFARPRLPVWIAVAALVATATVCPAADRADVKAHKIHDKNRPQPPKVDPGPYQGPKPAPADAIVLFDGEDLDAWQKPHWTIEDQTLRIKPKTGNLTTRKKFGDCQIHLAFRTNPANVETEKYPSNSGVFFGKYYEIQILDTYAKDSYADGICGAIYGQYPPRVDATRPPGQWQTYDIIYDRPRFEDGKVIEPATFTVFHNGVLIQHHEALTGPTAHGDRPAYQPHGKLPLALQDHGSVLWYKNIWVRELE